MQLTDRHREYWSRNMRIITVLMVIWFVVTFVVTYFARELSRLNFFGWPFSFWMAAQGSLIVYVLLIWYYARKMNVLDKEYGVDEPEES